MRCADLLLLIIHTVYIFLYTIICCIPCSVFSGNICFTVPVSLANAPLFHELRLPSTIEVYQLLLHFFFNFFLLFQKLKKNSGYSYSVP